MECSLATLKNIYDRCAEYVRYLNENGWLAQREAVSKFWAEILQERRNYPGFDDMLVMRRGATYPLADRGAAAASNPHSEWQHARAAYAVVTQSVPDTYFQGLNESAIGCPLSVDFKGQRFSAGAITNALTSYRILEWCTSTGLVNRPLRVLEIGAGYGQVAYQLFQQLKIASYTVCDLPENLFLSAFYLQGNFPDKKAVFVKESDLLGDKSAELVFLVPPFLNRLPGPFDVVINSYSFQEMNLQSIEEYFAFVEATLATDGLFYSLNAHRKAGAAWPSDYPFEKFRLISLLPVRKYPFQVFATNPYEVVMTKLSGALPSSEARARSKRDFDALGGAMQLGLHDDLLELCRKFSRQQLDTSEGAWLDALCDFLHSSDRARKRELVKAMRLSGILPTVTAYLAGSLEFAVGSGHEARTLLEDAAANFPDCHARARSYLMLACLCHQSGDRSPGDGHYTQAKRLVPHLEPEMSQLVSDYSALAGRVADQLGVKLPHAVAPARSFLTRIRGTLVRARRWANRAKIP